MESRAEFRLLRPWQRPGRTPGRLAEMIAQPRSGGEFVDAQVGGAQHTVGMMGQIGPGLQFPMRGDQPAGLQPGADQGKQPGAYI